mmetsp:Transcript_18871/g.38312  ORF Transcript_18871/g.38312 Transcript_18871/m.38312 type:complete len:263 (+) Transcript_18871:20-808(+)
MQRTFLACSAVVLLYSAHCDAFSAPHASLLALRPSRGSVAKCSALVPRFSKADAKQLAFFGSRKQGALAAAEDGAAEVAVGSNDAKLAKLSGSIGRATWLSWWAQVILSVVSTVTLFFANAVKGAGQGNILTNGIFLAGIGLALSFVNVFWTWGYSSMGRNLADSADKSKALTNLKRSIKVGVVVALSGMLITLFGAEQIVGTLVGKSMSGFLVMGQGTAQAAAMQLQALDILVVQANTNTLLSHWASLVNSLYISSQVPRD